MKKEYTIKSVGYDRYIVTSKCIKTNIKNEYFVDMNMQDCDCKGFQYRRKCKHLKLIQELLKDNGVAIQWQAENTPNIPNVNTERN